MRHHFRDIFECYIDILFYDSVASEDIGLLIDVVYKWVVAKTKWPNGKLFRFKYLLKSLDPNYSKSKKNIDA